MTDKEIKELVLKAIADIAPEADLTQIDSAADLREQIDLDSMDVLNLMIAIHEASGVDIPEADYPRIATLDACVAYLHEKLSG